MTTCKYYGKPESGEFCCEENARSWEAIAAAVERGLEAAPWTFPFKPSTIEFVSSSEPKRRTARLLRHRLSWNKRRSYCGKVGTE